MLSLAAVLAVQLSLAQTPQLSAPPPPPPADVQQLPPLPALPDAPRECVGAAECGEGATCDAGRCRVWCNTSRDCGRGLVCSGHRELPSGQWTKGQCREGVRGDPCRERRDCARGFVCEGPPAAGLEASCLSVNEPVSPLDGSAPPAGRRVRYRGGEVPPGFRVVNEPLPGLLIGGLVAFSVAYVLPIIAGAFNRDPTGAIPLVGPFLVAGNAWAFGAWSGIANFFLALGAGSAAAWQGVGIGMVIGALAGGHRWLEPAPSAPVTLVPMAPGSLAGASLVGHF